MNGELVVPWSTAPTKSGMRISLGKGSQLSGIDGRLFGRRQEPAHAVLVQAAADEPADERADDRHPEVKVPVLILPRTVIPGDELGQPGPEVTRRVDRI